MSTIDRGPAAELSWERFWQLIDLIGGEPAVAACAAFDAGCERLTEALAAGPAEEITAFGSRLAEALHRLDREEYGTQRAADPDDPDDRPLPLSDDGFLYARAAVIAAGRAAYERVLADPAQFARHSFRSGESLLHAHVDAFDSRADQDGRTSL
ncbi:DUF4240 domain-containing protein [Kitasatospora sp. NPDC056184]|uniref:DUF4240 domain-containing protein n=1 Tax=Kitasatospora sp. NPDC056184 TaxID=3345738 RepID=UPI0035E38ED3